MQNPMEERLATQKADVFSRGSLGLEFQRDKCDNTGLLAVDFRAHLTGPFFRAHEHHQPTHKGPAACLSVGLVEARSWVMGDLETDGFETIDKLLRGDGTFAPKAINSCVHESRRVSTGLWPLEMVLGCSTNG